MNDKKKYLGGLKVSLLLLFIMLFAISSNCYANVTKDFTDWTLLEFASGDYSFVSQNAKNNLLSKYNNEQFKTNLFNYINDSLSYYNVSSLNNYNCIVLYNYSNSQDNFTLHYVFSNCTFPNGVNDLGYFKLIFNYSLTGTNVSCSYIDGNIYRVSVASSGSMSRSTLTPDTCRRNPNPTINTEGTVLNIPGILNYVNTQVVYTDNLQGSNKSFLLDSGTSTYLNTVVPEPDQPSGDISGDSSGDILPGGTITNPSGEVTGKVDLTKIENGIDNINQNLNSIENKIPTSGDMQSIISGEVGKINNTLTNYDEDVGEDGINSLVSNISDTMSGELSNNEIFGALENAEQGFFEIISGQGGDFVISWNDVILYGVTLIPAGSINFSQICRDNESLGTVKEYINIILTAFCTFGLFKYLYNLFLATFGIDNPYLYEKNSDPVNLQVTDSTKHRGKVYDSKGNFIGWGRSS